MDYKEISDFKSWKPRKIHKRYDIWKIVKGGTLYVLQVFGLLAFLLFIGFVIWACSPPAEADERPMQNEDYCLQLDDYRNGADFQEFCGNYKK